MPGGPELLARIGKAYDFSRFEAGTQTKDSILLVQYVKKMAQQMGKKDAVLRASTDRIRTACKLGRSIDGVIDQHDNDPMIVACGKLAIAHFICQAEAKSMLNTEPRNPGELPLQGEDTWLFQLGQLVTSGVLRSQVERCLDNLSIICFNYDRAIEHFLPHAMVMAFGMELKEAQQIIAAKLNIIHPFGTVGRLPWQSGSETEVEWGTDQPWNILNLAQQIRTTSEQLRDQQMTMAIRTATAGSERLVFLGFGYHPQNIEILFDYSLSHEPEVIASAFGLGPGNLALVSKVLKNKVGIENDEFLMIKNTKCADIMREYSLLLET